MTTKEPESHVICRHAMALVCTVVTVSRVVGLISILHVPPALQTYSDLPAIVDAW